MKTCLDCNKPLKDYRAIRCKSCSKTGTLSPRWKNGKPTCMDCNQVLIDYRSNRCITHSNLYKMTEHAKKHLSNKNKGKRFSLATEYKNGHQGIKGEKCPLYIYGHGYYPYPASFNKQLKEYIRKRDNYTCQNCGIAEKKCYRKLDIHHIDYNKENCKETNLITLCTVCNIEANFNVDYWFAYYTYIMENFK